ncbi:MAG TPA: sialidase family protein [Bryobacteraceae bacterium]|jgi:hypothetical protein|nr:sialidase family protein [Bryobacteraceae bacterium]
MHSIILAAMLALNLGPMGPDAPAREPQLAASGSTVALTFGAGAAIYFTVSHDSGRTFSAPVKVEQAGNVLLTHHRGPRIAISGKTIIISAITSKTASLDAHAHGAGPDGDLFVWRSTDGGKTWSPAIRVNDVPNAPNEGLHTLAADAKGNLFAAWLDHRSGKGTTLHGARSADAGATWSKNFLVYQSPDGTICECCHPSAAFAPDGELLVMWRNWLEGSRDMYLTRSRAGAEFSPPEKLGMGTWKLKGCPMDGGGIVISRQRVFTAWRREGTVYLAEPRGHETALGQGKDLAVAAGPKGVYVAWVSASRIELRRPDAALMTLSSDGAFPALAVLSDGAVLAAWQEKDGITTRRVN